MPPKMNPLGLNALQLKTLTLLQELARLPAYSRTAEEEGVAVRPPDPHGDHIFRNLLAAADPGIKPLGDDVGQAIVDDDFDFDIGISPQELRQFGQRMVSAA